MLLVLQAKLDVLGEESPCFLRCLSLTVGGCIEDKCYNLSFAAGVCGVRAVLLHTCHSWNGHILEAWCMGEWGCVVV